MFTKHSLIYFNDIRNINNLLQMQNFFILQKKSNLYIMVLPLYFGNANNQCHFLIRNIYKLNIE